MNKPLAESDLATPKVTTGPIAGSRKIYARPDAAPELKVPLREIVLDASSGEPPLPVYDPSGPYTDPDGDDRRREGSAAHAASSGCASAAASSNTTAGPIQPIDNGNVTGKHLARNFANTPKPAARACRKAPHPARMGAGSASSPRK